MNTRQKSILWIAAIALGGVVAVGLTVGWPRLIQTKHAMLMGVNLPSATFAEHEIPGLVGRDYFYPDEQDSSYYVNQGMNVIRLGFMWERLQPELDKPFDHDEAQRLIDAVRLAAGKGSTVILDVHNYARYHGQLIGSPSVPATSFADLWGRLAALYRDDDRVAFGLMNEPYDIDPEQWRQAAQAAITSIRKTGARNRILVSSTHWDSAAHFVDHGEVWQRIVDPARNLAFEVHQYMDVDNTGTQPDCPNVLVGLAAVRSVTEWMRQTNHQAFLGEFGASDRKDCLSAMAHMLNFIRQNHDAWLGWTYFAGGRGWRDDDLLSITPVDGREKPQMTVLKAYLP